MNENETPETKPRGPGRPPKPRVISVIERRLQGPSVLEMRTAPIPLKHPRSWVLRWVSTRISPQHLWDIIHVKGWEYVVPEDLDCSLDEIGAFVRDHRIVRGERGEEVLVKMPHKLYRRLAEKKAEENFQQTFSTTKLKKAIVETAAEEEGDEAASFLSDSVKHVSIKDSRGPAD